jgi:hypothetical protein
MMQFGFCQNMRCQQDGILSGHLTGFFAAGNCIDA